jgi:basic membrane protein A
MKTLRTIVVVLLVLAILITVVACGEKDPVVKPTETDDGNKKLLSFAVVASDTIGDRGFNDMSDVGIKQAAKDFKIEYKVFSCNQDASIFLDTLKTAAENYDVIFVVPGYFFDAEIVEVQKLYPDKTYIYVDGTTELEGVHGCTFAQHEGAFLAGCLAAYLTTQTSIDMINEEKIVGFVGGFDMPVIHDYEEGFTQGVAYADPTVKAIVRYAGDHYNAELGKTTATTSFREGADVIFQAAGPTGLGILEAAEENKFYAIGVDTDQGYMHPGFIVSSMMKRVDIAVYDIVKKCCDGEALPKNLVYNVANGGISLAENEEYKRIVPADIQQKVTDIANKIAAGEIVVKSYFDE